MKNHYRGEKPSFGKDIVTKLHVATWIFYSAAGVKELSSKVANQVLRLQRDNGLSAYPPLRKTWKLKGGCQRRALD